MGDDARPRARGSVDKQYPQLYRAQEQDHADAAGAAPGPEAAT